MRGNLRKTITILLLVLCMAASMLAVNAFAEDSNSTDVVADSTEKIDECEKVVKEYSETKVKEYLAGDNTYPTLEGYRFAGWYTDKVCSRDTILGSKTPNGTTYALFVPEDVLSIKAQISVNLIDDKLDNDTQASLRFITSVDSLLYKEVGFEVSYVGTDGKTYKATSASNKVYRSLYVCDSTEVWEKKPADVFCNLSQYFKICTLKNFTMETYKEIVFTVTPYWVTADDTKVTGVPSTKSFVDGTLRKEAWVSTSGSDTYNHGSEANPYQTLDYALTHIQDGGKIHLIDTVAIRGETDDNGSTQWPAHGKKDVTITGGTLDVTTDDLSINDGVIFSNMTLKIAACADPTIRDFNRIFAEGHDVTIASGVNVSNQASAVQIFGGGKDNDVESTSLKLYSGSYGLICGGSSGYNVNGNVNLVVGEGVNPDAQYTEHDDTTYELFGGGYAGDVNGDITITVETNAKLNYIYGGGHDSTAEVKGAIHINYSGLAYSIYGGGLNGPNEETHIVMNGGEVCQIFGGTRNSAMNGNSDVQILGGTVHRRIYGGSYNDYVSGTGETAGWQNQLQVNGYTSVTIGQGSDTELNLALDNWRGDNALSALSRYDVARLGEWGVLIFQDDLYETYKGKIKGALETTSNPSYHYLVKASTNGEVYSAGEYLAIKPDSGYVATVYQVVGGENVEKHYTASDSYYSYYKLPKLELATDSTEIIVEFNKEEKTDFSGYQAKVGDAYYLTLEEALAAFDKYDNVEIEELGTENRLVKVTVENSAYGILTPDKEYCLVGDTVTVTQTELLKSEYYLAGLQFNNKNAALTANGTGSYVTTVGGECVVKGVYEKAIFAANDEWNLTKQNQGTVDGVTSGVVSIEGDIVKWLYLYEENGTAQYGDIDLTFTLKDFGGTTDSWSQIKFAFRDADNAERVLQLTVAESDGAATLKQEQHSTMPIGTQTICELDYTKYTGDDGIEVRVKREGTKILVYVDDVFQKSIHLSEYIENDSLARVGICHNGDQGKQVDISYKLSFPTKKVIGQEGAKYLSILGDEISMSTGKPENSDNNTTTSVNQTANIYGNGRGFGIGSDWTKLYWGQSLVTNNLQLLVNNSASDGLLYATRKVSDTSNDDPSKLAGYLRASELHADTGTLNGTEPDIIYLYMGTSDYMSISDDEAFADKYKAALDTITTQYENAEVFCFTVMPYYRPASNGWPPENMITRMNTFNARIREIASGYENVTLVDIEDIITSTNYTTYYPTITFNCIMPNAAAHDVIATRLQKALESQFEVKPRVTLNSTGDGTLSIESPKDTYELGETVVIRAEAADASNYLHSLTVDGTAVTVDENGTYSFTVSKVSYVVESIFRKKIFSDNSAYDLTKQNQGTVDGVTSGVVSIEGDIVKWLYLYEENGTAQYGDIDLTFTLKDFGGTTDSWSQIKFAFRDADNAERVLQLTVAESDGAATLKQEQHSTMPIGTQTICELDYTKYTGDDGIEVRVKREGTKILVYVDDVFQKSIHLSEYIENDSLARVGICHNGDQGKQVEISYMLSFPTKKVIGQEGAKYLSILGDEISMSTGKPENSDNNTTTSVNQTANIYGDGRGFGIGSDWTKLYWGQSLVTNNLQLLVNNSASDGLLYATRKVSDTSNDDPSKLAGYLRASELHADTGTLNGTEPDIIYLYMGTSDYMSISDDEAFADKYKAALDSITTQYENAEVFCFTVMPYYRPASNGWPPESMITRMNTFNNRIREIASGYENVTLVDIEDIITSTNYTTYYPTITFNCIMPNAAAHDVIAAKLQKALESQFKVESQVTLNHTGNGTLTITPEKDAYKLGETVEITATPANEQYYLDTLTIDGTPVTVDASGTSYSLTIDKVSYAVESTFRKKIFNDNTLWDLTKQNQGTDANGVTSGVITYTERSNISASDAWLYLYRETIGAKEYGDIDMILNVRNHSDEITNANTQVKFETAASNGYWFRFVVEETSDGGVKVFRTGTNGLNTSSTPDYEFLAEEIEAYNSEEGINIRVKREGTMFYFCIDGAIKFSLDLSDKIESDTKSAVSILHDNDLDITASIPYELCLPTREPLIGKYVSILGDGISMSAGETVSAVNNASVGINNTSGIQSLGIYRDDDLELGIGNDWTKLYWGQSLDKNGMNLLANNSVCEGKVSEAGDATTQKAAYDRADQLHADQGALAGEEPDIIYLYMGTEDRKQIALQNTDPAQKFEEKYRETLSAITTRYPQAEVFCFTTMAYAQVYQEKTQLWGVGGGSSSPTRMTNANNSIKKVASEFVNVTLVDIAGIITTDTFSEYFPLDGTYITPHVDAHTEIAEILQTALETRFDAEYDITRSSTGKGSVTIEPEKEKYRYGDEVKIVTTPEDENCYLAELQVDGQTVEVDSDGTYSFTVQKAGYKVEAVFKEKIALALNEDDTSLFYINDKKTAVADPFVLDNGNGNYYLYGTTASGLDLQAYKSTDLMTWTEAGSVLDASCKEVLQKDIWAPEVVKDGDTYYMFFSATPYADENVTEENATKQLMVATSKYPNKGFKLVDFTDENSCGEGNTHTIDTSKYPHSYVKYLMFEPGAYTEFAGGDSGYTGAIDPHPYVDGTDKYLFWKIEQSPGRICVVKMDNWLKPNWDTKQVVLVADQEEEGQCVEAPEVIKHVDAQDNTKYYLTYSMGTYVDNTYQVGVAVADSITGTYTKLTAEEGGILLSSQSLGNANITGTGHHSFVTVGEQLYIVYHRHDDPVAQGDDRNHAIDEVKWIQNKDNLDVMYVNGPTSTYQPKISGSGYTNIAGKAIVSSTDVSDTIDVSCLTDGLLSVQKMGNATFMEKVNETSIANTTTFTFTFDSAREVGAIMVYNSKMESAAFKNISRIEMVCEKDAEEIVYYINDLEFNSEYYTENSDGTISYVIPGSAAYAVFDELNVKTIKITVEVPDGQESVGISEIKILGK